MKNWGKGSWEKIFICLIFFIFSSCELVAKDGAPYLISGEMVIEESEDYEIAGLDLYIKNKSNKQINSFTLVFYLFDQDGNAPEGARSSVVLKVQAEVDAQDSISTCLSLDNFMYEIPEEPYFVDYMYLSKIEYTDGTEWKDPFGQQIF